MLNFCINSFKFESSGIVVYVRHCASWDNSPGESTGKLVRLLARFARSSNASGIATSGSSAVARFARPALSQMVIFWQGMPLFEHESSGIAVYVRYCGTWCNSLLDYWLKIYSPILNMYSPSLKMHSPSLKCTFLT